MSDMKASAPVLAETAKVQGGELEGLVRQLDAAAGDIAQTGHFLDGEFTVILDGKEVYSDSGADYCEACATKLHEALPAERRTELFIGHGYLSGADSCEHCERCGVLLDYSLSEHGVWAELDHFDENLPEPPLSAEVAYHLARVFDGLRDYPDEFDERAINVWQATERALASLPPSGVNDATHSDDVAQDQTHKDQDNG